MKLVLEQLKADLENCGKELKDDENTIADYNARVGTYRERIESNMVRLHEIERAIAILEGVDKADNR